MCNKIYGKRTGDLTYLSLRFDISMNSCSTIIPSMFVYGIGENLLRVNPYRSKKKLNKELKLKWIFILLNNYVARNYKLQKFYILKRCRIFCRHRTVIKEYHDSVNRAICLIM